MQSFTCTALLGIPLGGFQFHAPGCHGLWLLFPKHCAHLRPTILRSLNPRGTSSSGLGCSAFARHYWRNHFVFFSWGYWDVSLHPVSLSWTMNSSNYNRRLKRLGCPIRRFTDQRLLAAPRDLSQLATSFIASWHQGIHHKPLVAWSNIYSKRLVRNVFELS